MRANTTGRLRVSGRLRAGVLAVSALVAMLTGGPTAAARPVEVPAIAGANDFACRPAADRPDPVVLVHGSGTDAVRSFSTLAPVLRAQGYCVFAANLGRAPILAAGVSGTTNAGWPGLGPIGAALSGQEIYGVADIAVSATELAAFVATVQAATGAQHVALVGHSTGGTVIRQFLRAHPGIATTVVTLGTPYRGSTFAGLPRKYPDLAAIGLDGPRIAAQVFGAAGAEQGPGSPTLARLNADGETAPGVRYTAIASHDDEVITPPDTALLSAPDATHRDVWVQDGCAGRRVDHSYLLADRHSMDLVSAALADAPFPVC